MDSEHNISHGPTHRSPSSQQPLPLCKLVAKKRMQIILASLSSSLSPITNRCYLVCSYLTSHAIHLAQQCHVITKFYLGSCCLDTVFCFCKIELKTLIIICDRAIKFNLEVIWQPREKFQLNTVPKDECRLRTATAEDETSAAGRWMGLPDWCRDGCVFRKFLSYTPKFKKIYENKPFILLNDCFVASLSAGLMAR
jgi:hypothetical protein